MPARSNTVTELGGAKKTPDRRKSNRDTEDLRMSSTTRPRRPSLVPAQAATLGFGASSPAPVSSRAQLLNPSPREGDDQPAADAGRTREASTREIAFIDPGVADVETLLGHLRPEVEPVLLDAVRPAARQIAAALAGERHLAAIHIVAHGAPGRVDFTAGAWSAATRAEDADDLAAIGRALATEGGLRLWSCQTAAGPAGAAFVADLAQAAGGDLAAATGLVGAAARGGSWELTAAARPPLTGPGRAAYGGVFATKTWQTTGTTSWTTAANWNPPSVPASTDDIVIPGGGTQPTISSITDTTISSLTLNSGATLTFTGTETLTLNGTGTSKGLSNSGTISLGTSTITVSSSTGAITNNGMVTMSGGSLSDTNSGIANSGASAQISGWGVLTGVVTNSSGATIAVSGGILTVNSGLTNSASVTIAATGTLASSGTISNSGTITDNGGTLGTGAVSNTGTITGTGTISATATGSGGTITASGGTLNITGTVATGQTLAISSATASTLEISNTATTANAIALTSSNQTLEIGAAGNLTINAAENITAGNITMVAGSKLTMFGTVGASTVLSGTGTIIASGGTLDMQGNTVSSSLALQIAASSTLQLDGTLSNAVAFNSAASGTLDLTNPAAFTGTITGLNVDATFNTASNQIDFGGRTIVSASLNGSTLTVVDGAGQSYALTLGGTAPAAGTVVNLKSDGGTGTDIFLSAPAATDTFTAANTVDSWQPGSAHSWSTNPTQTPAAGTNLTFLNNGGTNSGQQDPTNEIYMPPTLRQATGSGSSIWTISDTNGTITQYESTLILDNEGQIFVNATNNFAPRRRPIPTGPLPAPPPAPATSISKMTGSSISSVPTGAPVGLPAAVRPRPTFPATSA